MPGSLKYHFLMSGYDEKKHLLFMLLTCESPQNFHRFLRILGEITSGKFPIYILCFSTDLNSHINSSAGQVTFSILILQCDTSIFS